MIFWTYHFRIKLRNFAEMKTDLCIIMVSRFRLVRGLFKKFNAADLHTKTQLMKPKSTPGAWYIFYPKVALNFLILMRTSWLDCLHGCMFCGQDILGHSANSAPERPQNEKCPGESLGYILETKATASKLCAPVWLAEVSLFCVSILPELLDPHRHPIISKAENIETKVTVKSK